MINDFLKKYQEELTSEKIQLKEDMDLLETKIKEETKFLSLLEESNESYFVEFTPRDINAKNNKKAAEIREILNDLTIQLENKSQQMKFYDGRLVEINALLTNTAVINKPSANDFIIEKPVENPNSTTNFDLPVVESTKTLKNKLSEIKNICVLDPFRAQIELENLISTL